MSLLANFSQGSAAIYLTYNDDFIPKFSDKLDREKL